MAVKVSLRLEFSEDVTWLL